MTTFSQHHLHFRCAARKIRRIFRWKKRTIFQWRRAKHNHGQAFVWKISAFCGGFWAKFRWILLSFSLRTETKFSGTVGAEGSGKAPCSIMLSSEMHKFTSRCNYKNRCFFSHTILPPVIRWILPLWGSWCGCLGPDCLFTHTHTHTISLSPIVTLCLAPSHYSLSLSVCLSISLSSSFCFFVSLSLLLSFSLSLFPSASLSWLYHPHCISVCPLSWYYSLCSFLSPPLCVYLPLFLKMMWVNNKHTYVFLYIHIYFVTSILPQSQLFIFPRSQFFSLCLFFFLSFFSLSPSLDQYIYIYLHLFALNVFHFAFLLLICVTLMSLSMSFE